MTRLEVSVDYGAITRNVVRLRATTTAQVMAVVKADAYGHGLVPASRAAREGGATWLGVAQPDEALALRAAGDTGRILTWLYGPELPARALLAAGVDLSASSLEVLDVIVSAARQDGRRARVHVCLDTGLAREGVRAEGLSALLDAALAADDAVEIVGAWSHLAWADQPGHPTIDLQAQAFRDALAVIEARGVALEVRHLANSAATLTRPDLHFDLVRPGIAVYGLPPVEDPAGASFGLEPAMSVTASLALVKDVPAGQGVSYGHDYTTPAATRLGLVTAGYADGIFRSAGNRAEVAIDGRRHRIAGRVCMDQVVLDLGPDAPERAGDRVVLIGPDGPSARDWARAVDTIDYEIVCRFGGLKGKTPA
ncbi:alanine racemase [Demequina sediminis]|uniref:Alanine racemase n=1 Tax=Demequina sediminis TaxID=1930058 RepID=A0ABP9WGH8_9MICO|nr:alanine racemase [Demequina sediminis]BDZ62874.1 alanine racemase [Demequina sediminis]